MEDSLTASKGQFNAVVCFNRHLGKSFCRLGLEFSEDPAKAFADFKPGQFVQLDLSGVALPEEKHIPESLVDSYKRDIILRRPFSFCNVTANKNKTIAEILYCTVGPASLRMTTLSSGDSVSLIGPLGNGFRMPEGKKTVLLVAGGMGVPPLLHLAKFLTKEKSTIGITAFVGAKNRREFPLEVRVNDVSNEIGFSIAEFAQYGIESQVATDDGSAGFSGLVTDCLSQWLEQNSGKTDEMIIYSCGPEAMLAKVAQIAEDKNIDCQISMERRMACGIGVCQSCAIECRVPDSNGTIYKLCCKDGPVFDAKEVFF